MTTAPEPGWYPDPAGDPELWRWWDGQDWTPDLRPAGPAPTPPPPAPLLVGPPSRAHGWGSSPSTRPSRPLRTLLVLTCGLVVFVAAGAGLLWSGREAPLRHLPLTSPPAQTATPTTGSAPGGQLDETTRVASIGPASLTLPGPPFRLYPDPMTLGSVVEACFLSDAPVHERYDGSHGWSATVALALLGPAVTGSDDLHQVSRSALAALAGALFAGEATSVRHLRVEDRPLDGRPGAVATAQVHYAIKNLPSRYDVLTVRVVRLDGGPVVAAVSSVPDDASAEVRSQASTSVRSLAVG